MGGSYRPKYDVDVHSQVSKFSQLHSTAQIGWRNDVCFIISDFSPFSFNALHSYSYIISAMCRTVVCDPWTVDFRLSFSAGEMELRNALLWAWLNNFHTAPCMFHDSHQKLLLFT
jgi:hypothetical protein